MKFVKKNDLILIAVLLFIGLGCWAIYYYLNVDKPAAAEIYYKSKLVETVYLTAGVDRRFSIPQKSGVVFHQYPDKTICFEESDCPDKICVKTGRIGMAGESAACLPNQIIIKIVAGAGQDDDKPDIIIN